MQLRCPLPFTGRFGNCLLRSLILCKMGSKLASALQWFCLLLFLQRISQLSHHQIPLNPNPLGLLPTFPSSALILVPLCFLCCSWPWISEPNEKQIQTAVFPILLLCICAGSFFQRSGKSTVVTHNHLAVDFSLQQKIQKARTSQHYDCKEIFTMAIIAFLSIDSFSGFLVGIRK